MSAQRFAALGIAVPPGAEGEVDAPCPRCSPSRKKSRAKCLSVNTLTGAYCCHHCGWAGVVGPDIGPYGAPLRHRPATPALRRTYTIPDPLPEDPLPPAVVRWFAARGILESTLDEAGIRWAIGAILFPYLRDGRLVNVKHRTLDKRFWMVTGAERVLYGLDGVVGAEIVLIVEGEIDALTIRAVGGPACVSVPDGAPATDARHYASKFSFLDAHALRLLRSTTTVLIGTDMDKPGRKLADELARRIGYAKCARVSWPHGCKDANETLCKRGAAAVLQALSEARPYPSMTAGDQGYTARPVRSVPPVRGRRPVVELSVEEVRRAG